MKYVFVLAIVMSAFYIGATKLLMAQLNDLVHFYSNVDAIAEQVADNR